MTFIKNNVLCLFRLLTAIYVAQPISNFVGVFHEYKTETWFYLVGSNQRTQSVEFISLNGVEP